MSESPTVSEGAEMKVSDQASVRKRRNVGGTAGVRALVPGWDEGCFV